MRTQAVLSPFMTAELRRIINQCQRHGSRANCDIYLCTLACENQAMGRPLDPQALRSLLEKQGLEKSAVELIGERFGHYCSEISGCRRRCVKPCQPEQFCLAVRDGRATA